MAMNDTRAVAARIAAIVNPATRSNAKGVADLLYQRTFGKVELDVRVTTAAGTATALARDAVAAGADIVLAVGGGGTVAEVATPLFRTRIPLGIVPIGTTNNVARELLIPTNLGAAVDLIVGLHSYALLDVGRCGERCFLHMAGAGLDAQMFAGTDPKLKRRLGWLAYIPPAVRHLRDAPAQIRMTVEGTTSEVAPSLILVANGRCIIHHRPPPPSLPRDSLKRWLAGRRRLHPKRSPANWADVRSRGNTDRRSIAAYPSSASTTPS